MVPASTGSVRIATLIEQGTGGSIIFVGSKNALAPSKGAAAYSAAKAAEVHLARCLADELGAHGIRVNTVNPDAVLEGLPHLGLGVARGTRAGLRDRTRRARGALPRARRR